MGFFPRGSSRIVFFFLCIVFWKSGTPKILDTAKMLCHVTRPDSVVMEVEVDAKANGEDCLNKVGCGGIDDHVFVIPVVVK